MVALLGFRFSIIIFKWPRRVGSVADCYDVLRIIGLRFALGEDVN